MNAFEKDTLKTEEAGKNKSKLTFTVGPERFAEGINFAYNRNKARFTVPGFRKGKAPRKLIERQYGSDVFFPDAMDYVLEVAYEAVIAEAGLDVVSRPEVDVESVSAEDGVVFTVEVYTKPEAEVANYRGLTYTELDPTATEDEINGRIEQAREKNSRLVSVTDRPAALGDVVTLDYEGSVDGVPFEGGSATDYELTLGSHTFIEGFEEQLVGVGCGDSLDVNVRFPDEYHAEELAGKEAVFKAAIKEIRVKELPELNDDFAQDVSEFDTFAEYRDSIAADISAEKAKNAEREKDGQVMDQLIEQTTVDIPPVMIEQQMDQLAADFKNRIESSGMPFNMYLQYVGQTGEGFRESGRQAAVSQVTARLALESIAVKEQFVVTEEELTTEIERMAGMYKMEPDRLRDVLGEKELEGLKLDLRVQKAADLVLESAVAKE